MISVVICSVNTELAHQIRLNIENTIGVERELIIIDNKRTGRGITEVYNEGAKKAKYPVVCFVHEDVTFLTQNWGVKILGYFSGEPSLGMVGLAGSKYKSKTPSGWMTNINDYDRCNVFHLDKAGNRERLYFDQNPVKPLKDVLILDGVFLCSKKEIITQITFDEEPERVSSL